MFGGKPTRGQPKPPSPLCGAQIWRLPHVGKRQIESPKCQNGAARMRRPSGGGQFGHFPNNSTMKQYFKMLISHEDVYSLHSPYCSVKVCSSPFTCCKEKSDTYYSETEPINRRQIWSPGLIRLHSILQATSLWRTVYTRTKSATTTHWNSKLFVIFPPEVTAAQSLHFQHLMWTEVMSSRHL